jgi:hypothetical protein
MAGQTTTVCPASLLLRIGPIKENKMGIIYVNNKSKKKKRNSPDKKELKRIWEETVSRMKSLKLPGRRIASKNLLRPSDFNNPIVGNLLRVLDQNAHRRISHFPSAPMPRAMIAIKPKYSGELAEREMEAQKEIERKKYRVAPLYSKGGYQLIPEDMDLTTLGRKV